MNKTLVVYLAGGLFNAGERLHNLYLEKYLKALGYEVVLPQREALRFFDGEKFDIGGIVEDCRRLSVSPGITVVASGDGPDADSGTAIEYALAITAKGEAVVYRTDFRTAEDRELGLNAMFRLKGTRFIYLPCYFTTLEEVDAYYADLARRIHEALENA